MFVGIANLSEIHLRSVEVGYDEQHFTDIH